jgi:hypothetical protein
MHSEHITHNKALLSESLAALALRKARRYAAIQSTLEFTK